MKKVLIILGLGIFLFTSCSDSNSIENPNEKLAKTRNDNCTMTLSDPDLVDDCDLFESITLVYEEIHILFDYSLFTDMADCMEQTLIYDPRNTVTVNMPKCGERNYDELYCTTPENSSIIVDLGSIEVDNAELELCFVTECVELNELLEDCFGSVGSSQGAGSYCFEIQITCE